MGIVAADASVKNKCSDFKSATVSDLLEETHTEKPLEGTRERKQEKKRLDNARGAVKMEPRAST